MKTKNRTNLTATIALVASMSASMSLMAETQSASDWQLDNSVGSIEITASGAGNSVTIGFPQQGSPLNPLQCDLIVGGADPSAVFTGNLLGQGYSGIQLKINGTGIIPKVASLYLRSDKGEWEYPGIEVSSKAGEWMIVRIPLAHEKGWETTMEEGRYTYDQLWERSASNVESLVLRLEPSGHAAQSYSISDFQLQGDGIISAAANLTPIQAYFEVDSLEDMEPWMFEVDSDGDGMSDYLEILTGTDPLSASSVFAARVEVAPGRNTISWEGVNGLRYAVWRSNNLAEGFDQVIAEGIVKPFTGTFTHPDDAPVEGKPNFYKVVQY